MRYTRGVLSEEREAGADRARTACMYLSRIVRHQAQYIARPPHSVGLEASKQVDALVVVVVRLIADACHVRTGATGQDDSSGMVATPPAATLPELSSSASTSRCCGCVRGDGGCSLGTIAPSARTRTRRHARQTNARRRAEAASVMPCALQTGRHGEFEMRLASTTAAPRVRARGPQIAHATCIWSGEKFRPLQRLCGTARGNQRARPPAIGCHGEFVRTLGARQQPCACVYGTCC